MLRHDVNHIADISNMIMYIIRFMAESLYCEEN